MPTPPGGARYHFRMVSECLGNVYSKPFPLALTLVLRVAGRTTESLPNVWVALRSAWFSSQTFTGPEGAPAAFSMRSEERRVGKECRAVGSGWVLDGRLLLS